MNAEQLPEQYKAAMDALRALEAVTEFKRERVWSIKARMSDTAYNQWQKKFAASLSDVATTVWKLETKKVTSKDGDDYLNMGRGILSITLSESFTQVISKYTSQ